MAGLPKREATTGATNHQEPDNSLTRLPLRAGLLDMRWQYQALVQHELVGVIVAGDDLIAWTRADMVLV